VSTVVFNGNPLMRYDGYYVLADWMEIPNLRERANRYLQNLFLEHCLGMEVQPEPYMETGRKVLFISYALVSYVYRWIVTFTILFFLYNFLKPYRLEVVSQMLTLASAASMIGWPIYNLGKHLYRRGRIPDMKRLRVVATVAAFAGFAGFFFLAPLPVNRLRGMALVMPQPESLHRFYSTVPGTLEYLPIQTGQSVSRDEVLATLFNRDIEAKLATARAEVESGEQSVRALLEQSNRTVREADKRRVSESILQASRSLEKSRQALEDNERLKKEFLRFVSPIDGIVASSPRKEDIGKQVEASSREPFLTIYPEERLAVCLPLSTSEYNQLVRDCNNNPGGIDQESIIIRVHGREGATWNGRNLRLLPSEARDIPMALTSRAGGPVAVKATNPGEPMVPQAQQFLVYIDIVDPDRAILPGNMAQVKIYLKPETCAMWLWRTVNDVFELGLFL
jgi:putative peptide zinc metalloprotease protein